MCCIFLYNHHDDRESITGYGCFAGDCDRSRLRDPAAGGGSDWRGVGREQIDVEGRRYTRVWGDTPAGQWAPPVVYDEKVTHPKGGEADFDLTHYSMLYQRELPQLPGRFEYLFVTAEDYGPDRFDVVYSLGTDVTTADLSIT